VIKRKADRRGGKIVKRGGGELEPKGEKGVCVMMKVVRSVARGGGRPSKKKWISGVRNVGKQSLEKGENIHDTG